MSPWSQLLGVLASGVLYALAFPPFDLPAAAWVALVPAFCALDGARPGRAALLGALHGTWIGATTTAWLVPTVETFFGRPLPITLACRISWQASGIVMKYLVISL